MNHFTEALGHSHCTLYMQDYGGPVGFPMALAHPDRIEADYNSFISFSDPDGNGWLIQEVKKRAPGR
jgi:pimeloyl-ACP methyl ester carboxylesterase